MSAPAPEECCPWCDDGDGNCAYPYYGVAPHTHAAGPTLGSAELAPREQWPENFEEDSDPEHKGCGTYTHCLRCGAPARTPDPSPTKENP